MDMYEVGGCVRDEILGINSKDIDFSVVLSDQDRWINDSAFYNDPFRCMVLQLERMGFTIYKEFPENLTARGKFNRRHEVYPGLDADFVLARDEGDYDGRRPGMVKPGTLEDDLARRDFTMNAIAKDAEGNIIDPFDGRGDIKKRIIRTVGNPMDRFTDDALRALRALRFSVTKGFSIDPDTRTAMQSAEVLNLIRTVISDERKREELNKMFAFDTEATLFSFAKYPQLTRAIFSGTVSLEVPLTVEATMKKRK